MTYSSVYLLFVLYNTLFAVSLVLGIVNTAKGEFENANSYFGAAIMFLFAILPMIPINVIGLPG